MAQSIAPAERGLMVSVLVGRLVATWRQTMRWRIDPVRKECGLVTTLAGLNVDNHSFLDFNVFPNMDRRKRFDITLAHEWLNRGQPLPDLSAFREAVAQACSTRRSRHPE